MQHKGFFSSKAALTLLTEVLIEEAFPNLETPHSIPVTWFLFVFLNAKEDFWLPTAMNAAFQE